MSVMRQSCLTLWARVNREYPAPLQPRRSFREAPKGLSSTGTKCGGPELADIPRLLRFRHFYIDLVNFYCGI